ncbi:PREDICTED: protein cereblon [Ceratosolen solmsi marchali]|uniref:Protein cereblon n=1 Tax=Ceratosolen solmsi marchali TaxID=326594 RepID=A0AAJ6YGH0_9HYME|nr:PREDICTED: protein cereblon [Ceratosolen solmsi marchali]
MENRFNNEGNDAQETVDSNEPSELGLAIDVSLNLNENVNINEDNQASSSSSTSDFDLNLPASHSYLGANLKELRGRTLLDDGIYLNLPLLIKESIILFPGQTLPLTVYNTKVIDMLSNCIEKNRTFGVVNRNGVKLASLGTTAEIYEYTRANPIEGFCVKAKGRQRFQILQTNPINNGGEVTLANVKILPEKMLPHPFIEYKLTSLDNQRLDPTDREHRILDKVESVEALMTHWPAWIYRQYDIYKLAFKIRQQLQFIETKGKCIPRDPTELSFWVAENLPLSNNQKIILLKFDCAISRLRWELNYLITDRIIVCKNCDKYIGRPCDIIVMNKEGPQSTFCNANGEVHDTITLSKAKNLVLIGYPSYHYSWFPGYYWTVTVCERCRCHMGWLFKTNKKKILNPTFFWGLTRNGLRSKHI